MLTKVIISAVLALVVLVGGHFMENKAEESKILSIFLLFAAWLPLVSILIASIYLAIRGFSASIFTASLLFSAGTVPAMIIALILTVIVQHVIVRAPQKERKATQKGSYSL